MGADNQKSAGGSKGALKSESVGKGDYEIQQGECLESIAYENGMLWKTIWDDGQNSDLKEKRKNPNALRPGDKVHIPDKRLREESGATEARHRFKRKGGSAMLKLTFLDDEGKARANVPYKLEIDGQTFTGSTDGDGTLQHSIPPNAKSGELILDNGKEDYKLDLRHLNPSNDAAGVQARLRNLGYDPGDLDGDAGPRTKSALAEFQQDNGLQVTGEPDEKTLKKLEEVHGG